MNIIPTIFVQPKHKINLKYFLPYIIVPTITFFLIVEVLLFNSRAQAKTPSPPNPTLKTKSTEIEKISHLEGRIDLTDLVTQKTSPAHFRHPQIESTAKINQAKPHKKVDDKQQNSEQELESQENNLFAFWAWRALIIFIVVFGIGGSSQIYYIIKIYKEKDTKNKERHEKALKMYRDIVNTVFIFLLLFASFLIIAVMIYKGTFVTGIKPYATKHIEHILYLIEGMFTFFGLVLAIITTVSGASLWWIRKKTEEAIDTTKAIKDAFDQQVGAAENRLIERLKKDIGDVNKLYDSVLKTTLLAADLALLNLPEIMYTHQIPRDLLHLLQSLDKNFDKNFKGNEALSKKLEEESNGARIWYARGLFHLGKSPGSDQSIQDLEIALERVSIDNIPLKRNILIRLCQAYRQTLQYSLAEQKLDHLARYLKSDPKTTIITQWESAVLSLQRGLLEFSKDSLTKRQEYFGNAFSVMDKLFESVFVWPIFGGEKEEDIETDKRKTKKIRYYLGLNTANLAYYTAKSMCAFAFTYPSLDEIVISKSDNENMNEKKIFNDKLSYALDMSLYLFIQDKDANMDDLFISAIYNYCIALILSIKKPLLGTFGPKNKDLFPELSKDDKKTYWLNYRQESLDQSKKLLDVIINEPNSIINTIYSESTEIINTLDIFDKDIEFLENVIKKDNKDEKTHSLFKEFYSNGRKEDFNSINTLLKKEKSINTAEKEKLSR